jgi:hypothetical protein
MFSNITVTLSFSLVMLATCCWVCSTSLLRCMSIQNMTTLLTSNSTTSSSRPVLERFFFSGVLVFWSIVVVLQDRSAKLLPPKRPILRSTRRLSTKY